MVRSPFVYSVSFMATGTPWRGGSSDSEARAFSAAAAASLAWSSATVREEFSLGLRVLMHSRYRLISSAGETSFFLISCASVKAGVKASLVSVSGHLQVSVAAREIAKEH